MLCVTGLALIVFKFELRTGKLEIPWETWNPIQIKSEPSLSLLGDWGGGESVPFLAFRSNFSSALWAGRIPQNLWFALSEDHRELQPSWLCAHSFLELQRYIEMCVKHPSQTYPVSAKNLPSTGPGDKEKNGISSSYSHILPSSPCTCVHIWCYLKKETAVPPGDPFCHGLLSSPSEHLLQCIERCVFARTISVNAALGAEFQCHGGCFHLFAHCYLCIA